MTVYVALLRAVNVAGTALPMAELMAICEGLGFSDVQTYIQSGNVLFRSGESETAAAAKLDAALGARLGKNPGVMIRSAAQLRSVADAAPFLHAPSNYLLVHFLPGAAPADALDQMIAPGGNGRRTMPMPAIHPMPRLPTCRSVTRPLPISSATSIAMSRLLPPRLFSIPAARN